MKIIKLEELSSLRKSEFQNTIKVLPTSLVNHLESIKLPIKNKEKAYTQIANFLNYLNLLLEQENKSVFVIEQSTFIKYFNGDTYIKFKQILSDSKILTNVTNLDNVWYDYQNSIAKTYRLHNEYINNQDYSLLIIEKNVQPKLEIEKNVHTKFELAVTTEQLDYEKVFINEVNYHRENNTSKFSLYVRIARALNLTNKRFIKQGTKVNRIYHSFSSLSKITRKCFKTKYFNIDISNSQPTFLVYYLVSNKIKFEQQYQEIVENGNFYELFYDLYNNDRDKVKVAVYESLFFAFNESRRINKRFKELFPLVWNELKRINEHGITLASILQNLEADLFNNIEVKTSTKFFTLFDAIYFNNKKDINIIKKQIENFGNKIGIKFSIKIEGLEEIKIENNTNTLEVKETSSEEIKLSKEVYLDDFVYQHTITDIYALTQNKLKYITETDINNFIDFKYLTIKELLQTLKEMNHKRKPITEIKVVKLEDELGREDDIKTESELFYNGDLNKGKETIKNKLIEL